MQGGKAGGMTGEGERVTGERWQVGKGGARAGDPPASVPVSVRGCLILSAMGPALRARAARGGNLKTY